MHCGLSNNKNSEDVESQECGLTFLFQAGHQIYSNGARRTTLKFNLTKWLSSVPTFKDLKLHKTARMYSLRMVTPGHHQALHTASYNSTRTTGTVVDVKD